MFYTMKQIVLLIAASLILVGASVVVAIPNAVEAAGSQFCTSGDRLLHWQG